MTGSTIGSSRLLAGYARRRPAEFANAVARAGAAAANTLLDGLSDDVLPAVAVHLPQAIAMQLLDRSTDDRLVRWLAEADLDTAVRLARRIGQQRRHDLARRLPARRRRDVDRYCSCPDGSVGAHVDTRFESVSDAATVADAVRALGSRQTRDRAPLLVVDVQGRFVGWLDAQKALLRGPGGSVRDCVTPVRPVPAHSELLNARLMFTARDESWLPVVDVRSRPIGLLHRSRLPDGSAPPASSAPALLATLTAAMFSLLTELPALVVARKEESAP